MTVVKKSEHKTPEVSPEDYRRSAMRELDNCYGHLIRKCGYCGHAHLKMYICSCGFDLSYADNKDENGNLVEVWSN